ncbi:MAG TPA: hypothetical protein VK630_04185 [Reyranella sp.]|nr:hypothetical protein [Reyranella sp.]
MLSIVSIALAFVPVAERAIAAGINIAELWARIREGLDAEAAPDDPQWAEADAAVNALMARALDPATDNR